MTLVCLGQYHQSPCSGNEFLVLVRAVASDLKLKAAQIGSDTQHREMDRNEYNETSKMKRDCHTTYILYGTSLARMTQIIVSRRLIAIDRGSLTRMPSSMCIMLPLEGFSKSGIGLLILGPGP